MSYRINSFKGMFLFIVALGLFLIPTATVCQAAQEENIFSIYGIVKSVNLSNKSFTLETGEKIYTSQKTTFRDMKGNSVSFENLVKEGQMVGVEVKEENGNLKALKIRESGGG